MSILVNTNIGALHGRQNVQQLSDQVNESIQKLTTGTRLTSSREDAAAVELVQQFDIQLIGLTQANRNANYGIAMAQIAEGSLTEISGNMQRARQLAVAGGSRTLSSEGRNALAEEFKELLETNNLIANNTLYGDINILNYNSSSSGFKVQSRPEPAPSVTVTTGNAILTSLFGNALNQGGITGQTLSTISANLDNTGDLGKIIGAYMLVNGESDAGVAADALLTGTREGNISELINNSALQINIDEFKKVLATENSAQAGQSNLITGAAAVFTAFADTDVSPTGFSDEQLNTIYEFTTNALLETMTGVISAVSRQRSRLGADMSGLESTIRVNSTEATNIKDARSRIADTDFAEESAKLARSQILQQAANNILAQANQRPNIALSLLR